MDQIQDYIQPYLDYFSAHPDLAIIIVFLIAFGEALLIIGLFVPSTAVLIGAGILVGTGHLPFWPVFLATAIGAIAGDQVSYWAGRLFGERLKTMWPLRRYPQLVARGEDYVRQHGGKSIAFGRFVPGVKAVVPGIVGMFGMGQAYFAIVNFSSGLVWTAAHVFPGILIGQGLAFAEELSGRLLVVLLILLVILAVAGYLIRLVAAGLAPYLGHLLSRISAWAMAKKSRSMRRFARAIAPGNPRSVMIVVFAAVFVSGAIILGNMLLRQLGSNAVSHRDVSVFNLMKEMRNAPADELMITLTMLGDTAVMLAVTVVLVGWLAWHKAYRAAIAAAISIALGKLFVPIIKFWVQRPRPVNHYDGAEAFSFPSGHATMAVLVLGVLAVLVSHSMGRWGRSVVYAICGMMVIAIAFSRVYLGAHWLSDVAAGLLFGTVMTAAFAVAIEAIPPRRIRPLGLFGAAAITLIVAGSVHIGLNYDKAEEAYAPRPRMVAMEMTGWQQGGWSELPARRIDLVGKTGETFLIQMAGNLDSLRVDLAAQGWAETPKWTWRGAIPYLNPQSTLADLPPRPALHEGLKARLTMIRPVNDGEREVLRVFKTNRSVRSRDASRPLYLLSLTREKYRRGRFDLYVVPLAVLANAAEREALLETLSDTPHLHILGEHAVNDLKQVLILSMP